jgi:hypothetical protein
MLQKTVPSRYQLDQAIEENLPDFAEDKPLPPQNIFSDESNSLAADDVQAEIP